MFCTDPNRRTGNRLGLTSGIMTVKYEPGSKGTNTPHATMKISQGIVTGVGTLGANDTQAPVRYFNLQGLPVPANSLTPGIYIRVQGNRSDKVVIR